MRPLVTPVAPDNIHLQQLTARFGDLRRPGALPPHELRFVFLCFTNRSGSNYLAELLAASDTYNLAGEFLNWDTVAAHAEANGWPSLADYFAWLARHHAKSGVLILKIAIAQVEVLVRSGLLDAVIARSTFLLLERSDKLDQAISSALAFATGRYTSHMAGSKAPEEVAFSRSLIDSILHDIARDQRDFDLFFGLNGIRPINIVYEQLVAHTAFFLQSIAAMAELPGLAVVPDRIRLERQAGAVNARWRQLYLSA